MVYSSESVIAKLDERFEGFSFQYNEVDYKGTIPVFFIRVNCTEEIFTSEWQRIVDYIGVHFQTTLQDEFSVWNLYLFFIAENLTDESLKYQIENNTFSSRKIVIDQLLSNEDIINDHIVNNDIIFKSDYKNASVFEHNSDIWKYLQNKEPRKKITEEDRVVYKKIKATTIKNRLNEN